MPSNTAALIALLTDALDADGLSDVRVEVLRLHSDISTDEDERNDAVRVVIRDGLLDAARRKGLI